VTGRKDRTHLLELNQNARDQGADISDASGPDRVRRIRDAVEDTPSSTVIILRQQSSGLGGRAGIGVAGRADNA
jgi:hypothetical protein